MAFILKDRVKENSTTTGTGNISLGGASATFDTFQSYLTNGDTTYYAIAHTSSGVDEWEVGLGTWNTGNTLSRTTVLAGSNGTSAVNFSAGTKDIFMTYPASKAAVVGEDVTFADITVTGTVDGRDVAADGSKLDGIDTSADVTDAVTVAAAGALMRSGGTMTGNLILNADPNAALGAATKQYVDTIASAGIHYHAPVRAEHPSNLNATYNNGSSGVGATLTNAGTNAALVIDSVSMVLNDRVLVANQTDQTQNGVYTVTTVGDGSTAWVLTRSTDTDTAAPSDPDAFGKGDAFFIKEGSTNAGHLDVLSTSGTIVFGTTNIVFSEVAETTVYSGGTGITLTGTTFSIGQDVGTTSNVTFNQVTAAIIGNVTGNLTGDVTGNADTATALETARTIQLSGDVTGSASFDGTANINITAAVQDDSHAHVISNVDGLQSALDAKVPTSRIITAGNGLTGGGDLSANRTLTVGAGGGITVTADTVAHADTSSQASVNNSMPNVIQDITLDTYGHVTNIASANLDDRYYTESEADSRYVNVTGDTMSGNLDFNNNQILNLNHLGLGGQIYHVGDTNTYHEFQTTDQWRVVVGGSERLEVKAGTGGGGSPHVEVTGDLKATNNMYIAGDRVFSEAYHPNADTLTTARTINGVSFNGSANITIADSTKLPLSGGTMTGKLTLTGGDDDGASPNPALEITHGTVYISHDEATIIFDEGQKMITTNDGNGNFSIIGGADDDGVHVDSVSGTSGLARMTLDSDGTDGVIYHAVGPRRSAGSAANLTHALRIANNSTTGLTWITGSAAYPGSLTTTSSTIFHDTYHPNADKWTTARTLSLSGDASGSVSWDGSANATLSVAVANDSHTHDGRYYTESEADSRFTSSDHFKWRGTGYLSSTTTSALKTELLGDDVFDSYVSAFKTGWSYAGNGDLTDAGRLTELAGTSWLTWTDNSSDNVQGNFTALVIAPNTGGSAGKMFVYNDQGSSYAPGWREIWTSSSDGSGSGLDADLLDGYHESSFIRKGVGYNWTATGSNKLQFMSQNTIDTTSSSQAALEVYQDNAGHDAFMAFHVSGDYGAYFGLHGGINDFVVGGWSKGATYQRVFHDGYHPNADKWTSSRTLSLTGAVTGSVSWDGSGNASLSTSFNDNGPNYIDVATDNYGTVKVDDDRGVTWAGYAIRDDWVFMANGDSQSGIYNDTDNEWSITFHRNAETRLYHNGSESLRTIGINGIRVGAPTHSSSDIYMSDSNEGERRIHCNSNRIGFLNSSSQWSAYSEDSGNWIVEANLTAKNRLDVGTGTQSDAEIRIYKADNNVSDHIQFYNGTTRIGEIGCQDTSWLRINQVTATNIYTPRYIRADGGFFVDGTTKGINGSGNFIGGTIAGASDYSTLLRSNANDTFTGKLTMGTQQAIVAGNYGRGVFGLYSATRYQHVWSMGTSYKTSDDGTSYGNMYGLTYTHTNIGTGTNQSISGLSHQLQHRQNGTLTAAIGSGIWTSGNVTAYSDIAVKTNLVKIPNALEKVCSINGYTYERTDYVKDEEDPEAPEVLRQAGVVAQEVEKVLPEVVSGKDGNKAVAYGNMVSLLIEAIKEQQAQIDDLKKRLK